MDVHSDSESSASSQSSSTSHSHSTDSSDVDVARKEHGGAGDGGKKLKQHKKTNKKNKNKNKAGKQDDRKDHHRMGGNKHRQPGRGTPFSLDAYLKAVEASRERGNAPPTDATTDNASTLVSTFTTTLADTFATPTFAPDATMGPGDQQEGHQGHQAPQKQPQRIHLAVDDATPVAVLLRALASDRGWTEEQVAADEKALVQRNRLSTVRDLRALGKASWADVMGLGVPPLVRDLLRAAIGSDGLEVTGCGVATATEAIAAATSTSDTAMASSSSTTTLPTSKQMYASLQSSSIVPIPATQPISQRPVGAPTAPNRMIVTGSDGKRYEVDRFCPHKGADMSAMIVNNRIICPKHKWEFGLSEGGVCAKKCGYSVHARRLDW